MSERLEKIQELSHAAAAHYVRRIPWAGAMAADLVQEAALAVLQAEQTFDPTWKVPFDQYGLRAAFLALQRYLWRNRGAVGATRRLEGLTDVQELPFHALHNNDNLNTYSSSSRRQASRRLLEVCISPSALPCDALLAKQICRRVRTVLRPLDTANGLGCATALDEREPRALARALNIPVEEVYWARKNLTRKASRSAELRALWAELRP